MAAPPQVDREVEARGLNRPPPILRTKLLQHSDTDGVFVFVLKRK